jgi:hypothetical protein
MPSSTIFSDETEVVGIDCKPVSKDKNLSLLGFELLFR